MKTHHRHQDCTRVKEPEGRWVGARLQKYFRCLINRWYNKKEPGLFILKSSVRLLIVWTSKTTPWVCRVDALIICRGSTGQYTVRYSTVQYSVEAINLTEVSRAPSLHSTQYNYSLPRPWLMLYKQAIN